jgi:hypothetical protein
MRSSFMGASIARDSGLRRRVLPVRTPNARTRAGRLARLDEDLSLYDAALLARPDGCVVDLGYGASTATTRELAAALPTHLRVVGVEAEPRNVPQSLPGDRPHFVVGGFDLPPAARPALVVRAMNVLRGYPPEEVPPARKALGEALVEGGLLVEGSCGPRGEVLVAGFWRRSGAALSLEALLFSTTFENGFGPMVFRDRLPRDLRPAARDGTVLHGFLLDWCRAYDDVRGLHATGHARFEAAAQRLSALRDDVPSEPERWAVGRLWWRPAVGDVTLQPHVALPPRV